MSRHDRMHVVKIPLMSQHDKMFAYDALLMSRHDKMCASRLLLMSRHEDLPCPDMKKMCASIMVFGEFDVTTWLEIMSRHGKV